MRRLTYAIVIFEALFMLFMGLTLGRSDPAGNSISQGLTIAAGLLFILTALPAIVLAHAGRYPRLALAFASLFALLCVGPYLLDRADLL